MVPEQLLPLEHDASAVRDRGVPASHAVRSKLRGSHWSSGAGQPPRREGFLTRSCSRLELGRGAEGDMGEVLLRGWIDDIAEFGRGGLYELVVDHHRHLAVDSGYFSVSIGTHIAYGSSDSPEGACRGGGSSHH